MDFDALMVELGITTQAELARRLGVGTSYLSDVRANRRGLTLKVAAAIERETGRTGIIEGVVTERINSIRKSRTQAA